MLLKFTHNMRVDKDGNISVTSEQIVDTEREAEEAGRDFKKYFQAFLRGYGEEE